MGKLWLIGLAASAAWTPAAIAKDAPHPPPPPPMAHGAHAPGHGGGHHAMPPVMHGGGAMKGGGHAGGMKGWKRFGRGHVVPPHFRGGQFVVHDWRTFGWPAPMPGGHWIRHHDDALLIDGHGRVVDGRYDWDWDRRGGRMAYDEGHGGDYGDGDYGDDDYDRDEGYGRDHHDGDEEGYGRDGHGGGDRVVRVYRHRDGYKGGSGNCGGPRCGAIGHLPPPPPPGYGYGGYGYGYGAGCACGPVVVTETITTTAPVMETRTYYETVEHRSAPSRHYRKKAVRHYAKPVVRRSVKPAYRAAPAPRPGERG